MALVSGTLHYALSLDVWLVLLLHLGWLLGVQSQVFVPWYVEMISMDVNFSTYRRIGIRQILNGLVAKQDYRLTKPDPNDRILPH